MVLSLYLRRGEFWDAVRDIRARWSITATAALPPAVPPGNSHLPPQHPPFAGPDEEGGDEWMVFIQRWGDELRILHDHMIPEECRWKVASEVNWKAFLSACVVYDPPVPGLVEFADTGALRPEPYAGFLKSGPDYAMSQSPIVHLRDAEKDVRAAEDFWLGVVSELIERYVEPQGHDAQEVISEVLFRTPEARQRWEHRAEVAAQNVPRPYIEVRPETIEQDVRSAFRMLTAAHERRPKVGRTRRELALVAECAILHDRHGWSYEQIAEHYGWQDTTMPSKYIKDGREVLDP